MPLSQVAEEHRARPRQTSQAAAFARTCEVWRARRPLGNRLGALVSTGAALPHEVQRWLVRVFGRMVIEPWEEGGGGWCFQLMARF